jgi:hypothetical protein
MGYSMLATATTTRRIPFAEVFPVRLDTLPTLYGYRLTLRGGDAATIGGKLAYRLRRAAGGHWTVTHGTLVGDVLAAAPALERVVRALKGEQPEIFKALHHVAHDAAWRPGAQARADFVARALFPDLHPRVAQLLAGFGQDLGQARAERTYTARGWVVAGESAVSLSITTRLVAKQPFVAFARQAQGQAQSRGGGDGVDALRGVWVGDATSSLKGQVAEVTGTVGALRDHLLSLTQREEMRRLLERAPDDEPVVRVEVQVQAGRTSYEYAASALRTIVRTEDYARFGLDAPRASQALRLAPKGRADLVAKVAQLAKDAGLLAPNAYRGGASGATSVTGVTDTTGVSATVSGVSGTGGGGAPLFLTGDDVGFAPRIRLGDGTAVPHDERTLPTLLARHGLYRRIPTSPSTPAMPAAPASLAAAGGSALRLAVLHALGASLRPVADTFVGTLRRELRRFGVETAIIAEETLGGAGRAEIERAYERLAATSPDLLLPLLPFTYASGMAPTAGPAGALAEPSEWGAYQHLKSLAVGQGLPSQVVTQRALTTPFALGNIALGVLGKAGAVPFVLAAPLPYADMVVGIDIARRRKERLAGSMNATAIARIYLGDGDFLRYAIHDAPLEGETIPRDVLQRLFPLRDFGGKRVVVHRDGLFRGEEAAALGEWARAIGATFHLVEVIKTGTPRLYEAAGGLVHQPAKGTALRLSEGEAFLVSSLPPFRTVTPNPLHLRASAGFPIERAIHSVLALTLLHLGSLRPPRLPVTIHYSDEIAYLALQGIKPKQLEGSVPYWL